MCVAWRPSEEPCGKSTLFSASLNLDRAIWGFGSSCSSLTVAEVVSKNNQPNRAINVSSLGNVWPQVAERQQEPLDLSCHSGFCGYSASWLAVLASHKLAIAGRLELRGALTTQDL